MAGWWIEMRILVLVVAPRTFAFAFPGQFGYRYVLSTNRANIPDGIEERTAFRTTREDFRWRGPQRQELEDFGWDIK